MAEKYKLQTNDTLKCSACGNKEFEEKRIDAAAMPNAPYPDAARGDCWLYICTDCGHVMAFTMKAEVK